MNNLPAFLFVGCGKMGGSVLNGILKTGLSKESVRVVEPNADVLKSLKEKGITASADIRDFSDFKPTLVFLAVKPFMIADVIDGIVPFAQSGAAILSIIAGRKIEWFEEKLGADVPVFRAMPNTPAAIGKGITGVCDNKKGNAGHKKAVETLLSAAGETVWLDNESQIDAVTAVSGSGPAYVFYLTEALTAAAIKIGLPAETAEKLAKATVCGAAALMESSIEAPSKLRQNVTTPNGTTAAALEYLMNAENGLEPLMVKAVAAAEKRSRELASA